MCLGRLFEDVAEWVDLSARFHTLVDSALGVGLDAAGNADCFHRNPAWVEHRNQRLTDLHILNQLFDLLFRIQLPAAGSRNQVQVQNHRLAEQRNLRQVSGSQTLRLVAQHIHLWAVLLHRSLFQSWDPDRARTAQHLGSWLDIDRSTDCGYVRAHVHVHDGACVRVAHKVYWNAELVKAVKL